MKQFSALLLLLMSFTTKADLMNLNLRMPTRLEDATPLKAKSVDAQFSVQWEGEDQDTISFLPNLRYGISDKVQFEVQLDLESGGQERYSGDTEVDVLWQVNESETWVPIVALNPVVYFGTGKDDDGNDYGLKIDLTSTVQGTSDLPTLQVHFNVQGKQNEKPLAGERYQAMSYALGFSRLISEKDVIVMDVLIDEEMQRKDTATSGEVGFHHFIQDNYYVGLGYARGLSSSAPHNEWIVAAEKQF